MSNDAGFPHAVAVALGLIFSFALSLLVLVAVGGTLGGGAEGRSLGSICARRLGFQEVAYPRACRLAPVVCRPAPASSMERYCPRFCCLGSTKVKEYAKKCVQHG